MWGGWTGLQPRFSAKSLKPSAGISLPYQVMPNREGTCFICTAGTGLDGVGISSQARASQVEGCLVGPDHGMARRALWPLTAVGSQ